MRGVLAGWMDAPWVGWGVEDDMGLAFLHALDLSAEGIEFFVDGFVAAVDVIDAVDFRGSVGNEASKNEGSTCAKVARHDGCAAESLDAVDLDGSAFEGDVRSHAFQFGNMHEALWENGFCDRASSGADAEDRAHLGLHVCGVARIGFGDEVHWASVAIAGERDLVALDLEFAAGIAQSVEGGLKVIRVYFSKGDAASGDGACREESAGLDPVGDDGVFCAMEFGYAFDGDAACACAFDPRSHAVQEVGEVDHLRFRCGSFDDGGSFSEACGHHDVVRSEDGGTLLAFEVDGGASETIREHFDIPVLHSTGGIE